MNNQKEQTQDKLYPIMQYFAYGHLPEHLHKISKPYGDLAIQMAESLPSNAETSVALRKLLESKDAAVRSKVAK
ncbi:MAG: hypothetical protein HRU28_15830 [Rhizobiales bacterium]|nr:hypothetical protein [Hyphomicrobiales bacterium]